jgi:hypothetical protein
MTEMGQPGGCYGTNIPQTEYGHAIVTRRSVHALSMAWRTLETLNR